MTVQGFIFKTAPRTLYVLLAAAIAAACSKVDGACAPDVLSDTAIEFSAHSSSLETKAGTVGIDDVFGSWDAGASSFTPGTGIGLFAFYQKAKSNGYPVDFNSDFSRPDFMYNQKLEVSTTDGILYSCSYSPKKYWPNGLNDQLSFFAYAPYDETTAWEDMRIEASLDGRKVKRHYVVRALPDEQEDFLWSDPAINLKKARLGETVEFSFRHICSRIGFSCRIDNDDDDAFVTIDRLAVRARFNVSGDMVFRPATGVSSWESLERPEQPVEYEIFCPDDAHRQRVTTTQTAVGGEDAFIFPFPGVQDIEVILTLTQNNAVSPSRTKQFTRTLISVNLAEGQANDFLLDIKSAELDFD